MKSLPAVLLFLAAGCSGFDEPAPGQLDGLPLARDAGGSTSHTAYVRCRFQVSIDSPWLAGEFEGVALGERTLLTARLRVQLFGDLGPKVADLLLTRDRVVGYFPQTREGIDCAIPREAAPHPLLFMGASMAEELLARESAGLVTGIREERDGTWLRLRPFFQGTEVHRFMSREDPKLKRRRFWWMTGVHWEEEWSSPTECRITAPKLSLRVKILERDDRGPSRSFRMDLSLPEDVSLVAGSRK